MIKITIDDRQILDFAKKSPARARWASAESLKMGGGHYRKKLRAYIEGGGENWAPLSEAAKRINKIHGKKMTPLYGLGQFVRFVFSRRGGIPRVSLGFMGKVSKIARYVQYGKIKRVTDSRRKFLHSVGIHLKKSTKQIKIPARPIIIPFWKKHEKGVEQYIETKFFLKFFSKEKPGLKL